MIKTEHLGSYSGHNDYFQLWVEKKKENEKLISHLLDSKKVITTLHVKLSDILNYIKIFEGNQESINLINQVQGSTDGSNLYGSVDNQNASGGNQFSFPQESRVEFVEMDFEPGIATENESTNSDITITTTQHSEVPSKPSESHLRTNNCHREPSHSNVDLHSPSDKQHCPESGSTKASEQGDNFLVRCIKIEPIDVEEAESHLNNTVDIVDVVDIADVPPTPETEEQGKSKPEETSSKWSLRKRQNSSYVLEESSSDEEEEVLEEPLDPDFAGPTFSKQIVCQKTERKRGYISRISNGNKLIALKRLDRGESRKTVAKDLGVVPATLAYWARTLGCSYDDEEEEDLITEKSTSDSQSSLPPKQEIICQQAEIKRRSLPRVSKEKKLIALKRLENGESRKKVAKDLGVCQSTITYWVRTLEHSSDEEDPTVEKSTSDCESLLSKPIIYQQTEKKRRYITRISNETKLLALKRLENGESKKEVAEGLGVCQATLAYWARTLGCCSDEEKPKVDKSILDCQSSSPSKQISCRQAERKQRNVQLSNENKEIALKKLERGEPQWRIANELGVCQATVSNWVKSLAYSSDKGEPSKEKKSTSGFQCLSLSKQISSHQTKGKRKSIYRISDEVKLMALERLDRGESPTEIANDCGVARPTVSSWANGIIDFSSSSDEENPAAEESTLGCQSSTFSNQISSQHTKGKQMPFFPISDEVKLMALERFDLGESLTKIANDFGVTPSAVSYWIQTGSIGYSSDGEKPTLIKSVSESQSSSFSNQTFGLQGKENLKKNNLNVRTKQSALKRLEIDESHKKSENHLKVTTKSTVADWSRKVGIDLPPVDTRQQIMEINLDPKSFDPFHQSSLVSEPQEEENPKRRKFICSTLVLKGLKKLDKGELPMNVAKDLGVSLTTVSKWINKVDKECSDEEDNLDQDVIATNRNKQNSGQQTKRKPRKNTFYKLKTKLLALKRLENGESQRKVAEDLGVTRSTLQYWVTKVLEEESCDTEEQTMEYNLDPFSISTFGESSSDQVEPEMQATLPEAVDKIISIEPN